MDVQHITRGSKPGASRGSVFDPAEHTVAEVTRHVADNPGDAQRVLEAERAGRNRRTLVSVLEGNI